jgi:ubiquinone/menaquinone biosynthesis C-methylase UbiE
LPLSLQRANFQGLRQPAAKGFNLPTGFISASMSSAEINLKDRVRAFWQANPCGTKFSDAEPGSRLFFERVEEHRYTKEWHIPAAAGFSETAGLKVLEVGCGLGTDGAQFAKAGADYTGVDLTEAAIELAHKRFDLWGLKSDLRVSDAENLDFPSETFDIVYSHGVLHHTPDTARSIDEIHRVLKPGGRAMIMLYHRDSYNYRVNIRCLRRAGARLLRFESGLKAVNKLTGEPIESLREHARMLRSDQQSYMSPAEFLNRHTDGAGNPLAKVYSKREGLALFSKFTSVQAKVYFLNKRWVPLIGNLLPRSAESWLASRWGWHLWIYAVK